MAEVMGVKTRSLERGLIRQEAEPSGQKLGRPSIIPAEVRLKLRNCYIAHYKQWGPRPLACWAKREGLGDYSPSTIALVIADLKEKRPPRDKPQRYEITAPNVMWSEDGAGFKERGRKHELLILQVECSRFKVNTSLVSGPAQAPDVYAYLREAFERHGAPLILKHDGGKIFLEEKVQDLLREYGVIDLTSPPYYPPYNGKMERSVRDIKSYVRAMKQKHSPLTLPGRIAAAIHDLNEERPRPVLGGKTAHEAFAERTLPLPDRRKFQQEIERRERWLASTSCSRKEQDDAHRRAVAEVLLEQGFMVDPRVMTPGQRWETAAS
jgi:transposase InsO family protein